MSQLFTLKSPEKYGKQFLLISAGFPKVSITCVEPPSSLIQVRAEAERREREEEMRRRQAEEEKRRRALAWNGGGKQWPDLYFFDDVLSPDWISSNNIPIYTYLYSIFVQATWKPRTVWDVYVVIAVHLHFLHHTTGGQGRRKNDSERTKSGARKKKLSCYEWLVWCWTVRSCCK